MAKLIKMSWFANPELKKRVMAMDVGQYEHAGQILGVVYAVKEREVVSPDGEVSKSWQAVGDFEAVRSSDNTNIRAGTAYLPKYFAQELQAVLERNEGRAQPFAVNVLLEATGKSIPVAWAVEPIMERPENDPITQMKMKLAQVGKLELEPPTGYVLEAPKQEEPLDTDAEEVSDDHIPMAGDKPATKSKK